MPLFFRPGSVRPEKGVQHHATHVKGREQRRNGERAADKAHHRRTGNPQ
jgi:hypothetical protein